MKSTNLIYTYYSYITYYYIGIIDWIYETHSIATIIECSNPHDIGKDVVVHHNDELLIASTREELNKLITFR